MKFQKRDQFKHIIVAPVVLMFTLDSPYPDEHARLLRPDSGAIEWVARELNMIGDFVSHEQEFSFYWADQVFLLRQVLKPSFPFAMMATFIEHAPKGNILRYPLPLLEDASSFKGKLCYAFGGMVVTPEGQENPAFTLFFGPEATARAVSECFEIEESKIGGDDTIIRRDRLFERLKVLAPELAGEQDRERVDLGPSYFPLKVVKGASGSALSFKGSPPFFYRKPRN